MNPLRRLPVALAFLSLLAVPLVTQGKPSSATAPAKTKAELPAPTASSAKTSPKKSSKSISKHIRAVKKAKPLTIEAKREVVASMGVPTESGEFGPPIAVSVAQSLHRGVSLSFGGLSMVLPARGVAVIGEFDSAHEPDRPPLPRICPPLATCVDNPRLVFQGEGYATVRFRAGADTAYVVDCLASGDADLVAQVIVDKKKIAEHTAAADGNFDVYVEAGPRRDIRIDLLSASPWTITKCELTGHR